MLIWRQRLDVTCCRHYKWTALNCRIGFWYLVAVIFGNNKLVYVIMILLCSNSLWPLSHMPGPSSAFISISPNWNNFSFTGQLSFERIAETATEYWFKEFVHFFPSRLKVHQSNLLCSQISWKAVLTGNTLEWQISKLSVCLMSCREVLYMS